MKIHYFEDGARLVAVFDELTPQEKEELNRKLEEQSAMPEQNAYVKPIEVYNGKILNGRYRMMTAQEALSEGGDDAFLWLSRHMRCDDIAGNCKSDISGALNSYIMTRFAGVSDPSAYAAGKGDDECSGIINAFRYAVPKKMADEIDNGKLAKMTTQEKRSFVESVVRILNGLAKKYGYAGAEN